MEKKTFLIALTFIPLLFLPSCVTVMSQNDYAALNSNLAAAHLEIDDLKENLATLQLEYNNLQIDYDSLQASDSSLRESHDDLQAEHNSTQRDYHDLQMDYESLLGRLQQTELEDPTWLELKKFLERDDTDEIPYTEKSFDCSGYAITLRDRAWRYGIRSAYVEIGFYRNEGHALNAFETTDKGLIYVDDTEADQIAYVKMGEPYGVILLEVVKERYIACEGEPDRFWEPLTYTTRSNFFSYNYYIDYQRRVQFYDESVDAFNQAVAEYNKGKGGWTYSQLSQWRDNLEELSKDLGPIFDMNAKVVESIEAYWD